MTGRRVLIVEDESSIASVLIDALGDEGYEVRHAIDGRTALDELATWLPDAILLDLMLPVMDGWAFRDAQRALDSPAARVPVVVLTGVHQAHEHAARLDAVAILTKPFDLTEVIRCLATACTRPPP